jgi:hypothetical protein
MTVLDEFTTPSLRETMSVLMSASRRVDMALTRMRLAGINLSDGEVGKMERLRVVIGKLDADALLQSQSRPVAHIERLRAFGASGNLEIRSVPRFHWDPDFSIYDQRAALIGAHYNDLPYPADGIAFTCVVTNANAIRRSQHRFDEMWQRGYDVLPVVIETLDALLVAAPAA